MVITNLKWKLWLYIFTVISINLFAHKNWYKNENMYVSTLQQASYRNDIASHNAIELILYWNGSHTKYILFFKKMDSLYAGKIPVKLWNYD